MNTKKTSEIRNMESPQADVSKKDSITDEVLLIKFKYESDGERDREREFQQLCDLFL